MSTAVLPSNSTELEIALVGVGSDIIDAVRPSYAGYFDPYACPVDALPFLAHTLGLPIWRESWSVEKKRWVLDQWPGIAGKLGTEDAIRWAVQIADAFPLKITTPPQMVFAGLLPEDNAEAWERWLTSLPEIQLRSIREAGAENGACGELDYADHVMTPGMFLGDEEGAATFFAAGPLITEKAVIIRGGVEYTVSFTRRRDPRVGRVGDVIDFFWSAPAGSGVFADDARSVDMFLDGVPPAQTEASVKFGYGTGSDTSWNLIGKRRYIQDVSPRLGVLYDEDNIGIFADEPWGGQFLDELDPIRGTYQSFRIMDGHADRQPVASFFDDARFGMEAYTAEILTRIPGKAGLHEAFANDSYADETFACADTDTSALDLVCDAVTVSKSHRDVVFIDLDIPPLRLRDIRSWSELKSLR